MIYLTKGDVTNPIDTGSDIKVIFHCVNDEGAMGSGVALALLNKWPMVKERYLEWFLESSMGVGKGRKMRLGEIQLVKCEENIYVCNIVGQKGYGKGYDLNGINIPPVRYEALYEGFARMFDFCRKSKKTIDFHGCLLGGKLAGGSFPKVYSKYYEAQNRHRQAMISNTFFYAFSDEDYNNTIGKCSPPILPYPIRIKNV